MTGLYFANNAKNHQDHLDQPSMANTISDFKNSLKQRVPKVRARMLRYIKEDDRQYAGRMFNDDSAASDIVAGVVLNVSSLYRSRPEVAKLLPALGVDENQVKSGDYDELIKYVLIDFSHRDYLNQNSLDLH